MRTTITIDDEVAKRLSEMQKRLGVSFKEIVNLMLQQGLERQHKSLRNIPRFSVKARPMGLTPGINYANIGELLEQLEGARHK